MLMMKLLLPTNPITEYETSNTASISYLSVCRGNARSLAAVFSAIFTFTVNQCTYFTQLFIRSEYAFEFHIIGNFELAYAIQIQFSLDDHLIKLRPFKNRLWCGLGLNLCQKQYLISSATCDINYTQSPENGSLHFL